MSIRLILITFLCFSLSPGCEYQKVLKKGTLEQKLDIARKYYNKGDYARAQIMLEQLIGKFQRGDNSEEVYFLFSFTHFGMNDYALASYHFQNFVERYPQSKYHEQAAFMIARCEFEKTLVAELDQTNTKKAIEAIQLFINRYPASASVETGNQL
ncbi:MAG: outer membrane protein assembly factor BamD, partial [bacterium]